MVFWLESNNQNIKILTFWFTAKLHNMFNLKKVYSLLFSSEIG